MGCGSSVSVAPAKANGSPPSSEDEGKKKEEEKEKKKKKKQRRHKFKSSFWTGRFEVRNTVLFKEWK